MSATLGSLLQQLEPTWTITIFERLGDVALESSNAWNNAGTGHSALCELNYTPELADGTIDISSAVKVNEQFQVSRQFWSFLLGDGDAARARALHQRGAAHELRVGRQTTSPTSRSGTRRSRTTRCSRDSSTARTPPSSARGRRCSSPVARGRSRSPPRASPPEPTSTSARSPTCSLDGLLKNGAKLKVEHRVTDLHQRKDGTWKISLRHEVGGTPIEVDARFVFVGAGRRGAQPAAAVRHQRDPRLRRVPDQRSVPAHRRSRPSSRSTRRRSTARPRSARRRCRSRTSTRASSTASASLLFGPYAGFTPKFLKTGSYLDLFAVDPLAQPRHDDRRRADQPLAGLVPRHRAAGDPGEEAPRPAAVRPARHAAATGT